MAFLRATKNTSVASRAAAYAMPGIEVDGSDVMAVYKQAGEAIERARSGGGPTLVEFKTYRFVGHHEGDPGTGYRTKEEVESWKKRDPIKVLRQHMLDTGQASETQFKAIEKETEDWLEDAVQFARNSPLPDPKTALDYSN
jgi:2-oxoisovalerate dehydrogenase E1 component